MTSGYFLDTADTKTPVVTETAVGGSELQVRFSDCIQVTHSTVDRCFVCLQCLAIVENAAGDVSVVASWCMSVCWMDTRGQNEAAGVHMFSFSRPGRPVFLSGTLIYTPTRTSFHTYPRQFRQSASRGVSFSKKVGFCFSIRKSLQTTQTVQLQNGLL